MAHVHTHDWSLTGRRLGLSVLLTLALVGGEFVVGWLANSLALLSDSGHNFADALALLLSWWAVRIARRPANAKRTYGYHRAGILVALVNSVSLVVISGAIFWEAAERLWNPEPVAGAPMIIAALAAIAVNGIITYWLHKGAHHDLNVRSAYIHMLGDALSSVGVVVAGLVVALTGSTIPDALVSFLIGGLILVSAWGILTEAVEILLESVPRGLDMDAVEREIHGVEGVLNVHDLHVWTLASGIVACSCHILVAEQSVSSGQQVLRGVADMLEHRFGIVHTTVQVEVEGCDPNDMYCTMRRHVPHEHHH